MDDLVTGHEAGQDVAGVRLIGVALIAGLIVEFLLESVIGNQAIGLVVELVAVKYIQLCLYLVRSGQDLELLGIDHLNDAHQDIVVVVLVR